MKKVFCVHKHVNITAPGGHRVEFINHRAVVPDVVADALMSMGTQMFQIVGLEINGDTNRVLIIRDQGIGDIIMTTPLVRWLATKDGLKVDYWTLERHAPLLNGNPYIKNVHFFENGDPRKDNQYDATIDLRLFVEQQEAARIHRNRVKAFLAIAEKYTDDAEQLSCDLYVTNNERERAKMLIDSSSIHRDDKPKIGYVWSSSTDNRNWNHRVHSDTIHALLEDGLRVIVIDHRPIPLNIIHAGYVNLGAKTSLRDSIAVIEQCDVIVTPDTGLFHVASALNKPVVPYFGAFPLVDRQHHNKIVPIINKDCPLLPCRKYICLARTTDNLPRCLNIAPHVTVAAVRHALEQFGSVKNGMGAANK